jgi:polyisoprenoid-binding protein YceI
MIHTNPTNAATLAATKWLIDPTHSEIQFKVKQLTPTINSGILT